MVLKGVLSHFALCQKDTFFKELIYRYFTKQAFLLIFFFVSLKYIYI